MLRTGCVVGVSVSYNYILIHVGETTWPLDLLLSNYLVCAMP